MFGSLRGMRPETSLSKLLQDPDADVNAVLSNPDLPNFISESESSFFTDSQPIMIEFVSRKLPRIVAVTLHEIDDIQENDDQAADIHSNAKRLLNCFVSQQPSATETCDAINSVIPALFAVFSKSQALHAATARAVKDIIMSAKTADFTATLNAVAVTLEPVVMHGVIRHASSNSIIAELMLTLLSAPYELRATNNGEIDDDDDSVAMPINITLEEDELTQSLTDLDFPFYLAQYATVAMASVDCTPYFHFLSELLKRGLTEHAGPLIDGLLSPKSSEAIINAVSDACKNTSEFPLAASGVAVLSSMMRLIAHSLPPPTDNESYEASCNIDNIAPLSTMGCRVCDLATALDTNEARVGRLRLNIITLFSTLLEAGNKELDSKIVESTFFPNMFALISRSPQHNMLLDTCFGLIKTAGQRPYTLLIEEVIAKHQLCESMVKWFTENKGTPLCSFVMDLRVAVGNTWNTNNVEWVQCSMDMLEHLREQNDSKVYKGDEFKVVGSASSIPPAKHMELVMAPNVTAGDIATIESGGSLAQQPTSPLISNDASNSFGSGSLSDAGSDRSTRYASVGFDNEDDDDDELPNITDGGNDFFDFESGNMDGDDDGDVVVDLSDVPEPSDGNDELSEDSDAQKRDGLLENGSEEQPAPKSDETFADDQWIEHTITDDTS